MASEMAMVQCEIELSFPSELGNEKIARDTVEAFARRCGFTRDQIEDLKTALGEACINAIEHGNQRQPELRVQITCNCDGRQLVVQIYDHGLKVYENELPRVDMARKLSGQAALRGMGLLIISQLVDEAGFSITQSGGNCFWFVLQRSGSSQVGAQPDAWMQGS